MLTMDISKQDRICFRCGLKGSRFYIIDGKDFCSSCRGKEYRKEHPEIYREWRAKNIDYIRNYQAKWRATHKKLTNGDVNAKVVKKEI